MHCKDVSVRDVDIPLTSDSISELMSSWRSYVRTEGLVLRNGDEHAVLILHKSKGAGLFKDVESYDLISLPENTVFIEDPEFDVINMPALASLQSRFPGKAIIVKGMFSHINFVYDIEPLTLEVVENIPPEPSKLGTMVKIALASGFVGSPIVVNEKIIDLADEVPNVKTEAVMFPCKVSGLTADMPVYFLDEAPKVEHEVTLIGCHLSMRIFSELYGYEPPFLNVCPADFTGDGKSIVKCCKVKEGFKIEGNVAKVPWSATVPEVVDAINSLFQ